MHHHMCTESALQTLGLQKTSVSQPKKMSKICKAGALTVQPSALPSRFKIGRTADGEELIRVTCLESYFLSEGIVCAEEELQVEYD